MPAPDILSPDFLRNMPLCACVDIGGTKIAASLLTPQGLQYKTSVATPKTGTPLALAQAVLGLIAQVCERAGVQPQALARIAIATCGPLQQVDGAWVLAAPNICGAVGGTLNASLPNDWQYAPLQAPIQAALPQAQLYLALDTVAALQAERRWGALQGFAHCAYVTWSTGIGAALCVEGQVLRGKNGNAGHLGHSLVQDKLADACGCGNAGDVEAVSGGHNWSQQLPALGFVDLPALFAAAQDPLNPKQAQALAQIQARARILGRAIYNLVVLGDLERVAIGGSVFWQQQALLLPLLQREVTQRFAALTAQVQIVPAGLGLAVGDYAALALCAEREAL